MNLFFSEEWAQRVQNLGMHPSKYVVERFRWGLRVAKLSSGQLADLETWPSEAELGSRPQELKNTRCDWVVYRKLLDEEFPSYVERAAIVTPYSNSPYLDLSGEIRVKKEVLSHILRTERKITREIGTLELREADSQESREDWFRHWRAYELESGRFTEPKIELFRKWTMNGSLPPWIKLITLRAGGLTIAAGLFYLWNGTFYYYAPVMNPDQELRKYGPGKLFVHKLIEYAREQGCTTFDFLQGEHSYKFHWNPEFRQLHQCIVPVSLYGSIALLMFRLRRWLRAEETPV